MTRPQLVKALEWASIGRSMGEAAAHFGVARSTFRASLERAKAERLSND